MKFQLALFYHTLFYLNAEKPELSETACHITYTQMQRLAQSGLLDACQEFHVGINGGAESEDVADLFVPAKATRTFHGLQCRNELRTLLLVEEWVKNHPDWNVLYFHCKGATKQPGTFWHKRDISWRGCMMTHLVDRWTRCITDLRQFESVGCHWLGPPRTPGRQYIWAGNFWWARSSFLQSLPPIESSARVKLSGVDALESRYEAEVWLGSGSRPPTRKDYHQADPSYKTCP